MCAKPRGLGLGRELMKEEGSLFPSGDDPREVPAEVWSREGGRPAAAQLPAPALPSGGPGPLALIPHRPNLQPQATPWLVPHSGLSREEVNSGGRCQTTQEARPPPPGILGKSSGVPVTWEWPVLGLLAGGVPHVPRAWRKGDPARLLAKERVLAVAALWSQLAGQAPEPRLGPLTFGWLCHPVDQTVPGTGQEPTPACIFEPSMEPFECEHKTPVSQGLGEGRGKEANLVATPLGCQSLP